MPQYSKQEKKNSIIYTIEPQYRILPRWRTRSSTAVSSPEAGQGMWQLQAAETHSCHYLAGYDSPPHHGEFHASSHKGLCSNMWSLSPAQGAFRRRKKGAKRNDDHACSKPPLNSGLREHALMRPGRSLTAFTAVLGRHLHRADNANTRLLLNSSQRHRRLLPHPCFPIGH